MIPTLLEQAARLAQGPNPALARPFIERILASDGSDAGALSLLGLVLQRSHDPLGAVEAFSRASAADPGNPAYLANLGVALKQAGGFEEAVAAFEQSLSIRPAAPGTLANLGSCLIAAGRHREAVAPLRKAVSIDENHPDSWNNLGVALRRCGAKTQAVAAYRQALAIRPDYAEAALNLADVTDASEAETIALRVLQDQPGHPRAANIIAAIRDRAGDLDGAIIAYRSALDIAPNVAVGINLTMALLRANRPDEALTQAERIIAENPHVTTPLALKCIILERLGQSDKMARMVALDRFVKIIDLPNDLPFHAALEAELRAHCSLTFEPEGLVTRDGRQSDDLANETSPAIGQLARLAREQLGNYFGKSQGDDRPWLAARPAKWSLTMWGTILQPGGAVEPHIHAPNWLSGVYYPTLPDAVEKGEEGGLAVGLFPEILGGGGKPQVFAAKSGRMILFPSWLWHATLPFTGRSDRISFAFDLVPDGIGQKHFLRK